MRVSWFYKGFLFVLAVSWLLGCNPYKDKSIDPDRVKFSTSDPSEIFFKNVRQSYYDKTEMKDAKLDVFRINERVESAETPNIDLAIVINWRYDEAYVLTEPNKFFEAQDTINISWEDTVQHVSGNFQYIGGNKESQFTFATQIYNHLLAKHLMFTLNKVKTPIPFLHQVNQRDAFRKTMFDYYRLVDLL